MQIFSKKPRSAAFRSLKQSDRKASPKTKITRKTEDDSPVAISKFPESGVALFQISRIKKLGDAASTCTKANRGHQVMRLSGA